MSIDEYGANINKYMNTLPVTGVLIVYFTYSQNKTETKPHIVEDVRIMKKYGKEWLMNC